MYCINYWQSNSPNMWTNGCILSGDGSTSTLSTQSVDDTVNGTRVLCGDDDVNDQICILG